MADDRAMKSRIRAKATIAWAPSISDAQREAEREVAGVVLDAADLEGPISRRSVGVAISNAVNRETDRMLGEVLKLNDLILDLQAQVDRLRQWGS